MAPQLLSRTVLRARTALLCGVILSFSAAILRGMEGGDGSELRQSVPLYGGVYTVQIPTVGGAAGSASGVYTVHTSRGNAAAGDALNDAAEEMIASRLSIPPYGGIGRSISPQLNFNDPDTFTDVCTCYSDCINSLLVLELQDNREEPRKTLFDTTGLTDDERKALFDSVIWRQTLISLGVVILPEGYTEATSDFQKENRSLAVTTTCTKIFKVFCTIARERLQEVQKNACSLTDSAFLLLMKTVLAKLDLSEPFNTYDEACNASLHETIQATLTQVLENQEDKIKLEIRALISCTDAAIDEHNIAVMSTEDEITRTELILKISALESIKRKLEIHVQSTFRLEHK